MMTVMMTKKTAKEEEEEANDNDVNLWGTYHPVFQWL